MFSLEEPISPRRKWAAIAAATFVMLLSYWAIVFSFVAGAADDETIEGGFGAFAFGVAMAPFAFIVLSFGSKSRKAATAVLKAMGLFVVVGAGVIVLTNLVTGLVLAFGAGGMLCLRREEEHSTKVRLAFLGGATLYVFILLAAVPAAGVLTGGVTPFLILGIADGYAERKAERAAEAGP